MQFIPSQGWVWVGNNIVVQENTYLLLFLDLELGDSVPWQECCSMSILKFNIIFLNNLLIFLILPPLLTFYPSTLLPSYPPNLQTFYPPTLPTLPFYPSTLLPSKFCTLLPSYPSTLLPFYPTTLLPFYPFNLIFLKSADE